MLDRDLYQLPATPPHQSPHNNKFKGDLTESSWHQLEPVNAVPRTVCTPHRTSAYIPAGAIGEQRADYMQEVSLE
ncbi:hypothetical protein, partial [Streptomyces kaempferi]